MNTQQGLLKLVHTTSVELRSAAQLRMQREWEQQLAEADERRKAEPPPPPPSEGRYSWGLRYKAALAAKKKAEREKEGGKERATAMVALWHRRATDGSGVTEPLRLMSEALTWLQGASFNLAPKQRVQ